MTVTNRATLTADATRRNAVTAAPFADPSAKNDRGEPNGYIRLGNKRAGAPGKPKPGEIAVDIDRRTVSSAIHSSCATPPTRPHAPT
jgi:hypothetical protein